MGLGRRRNELAILFGPSMQLCPTSFKSCAERFGLSLLFSSLDSLNKCYNSTNHSLVRTCIGLDYTSLGVNLRLPRTKHCSTTASTHNFESRSEEKHNYNQQNEALFRRLFPRCHSLYCRGRSALQHCQLLSRVYNRKRRLQWQSD